MKTPANPGPLSPQSLTEPGIDSAAETAPACPHFGPCGGCQLQHLTYPTQLAQKQQTLESLLTGLHAPAIQTHAAGPLRYRNRVRLRVEPGLEANTFALGYNRHTSNTFLPIHTCPISAPALLRAAKALLALASTHPGVAPWLTAAAELELFTLPDESHLQLTLLLRTAPSIPAEQQARSFRDLCDALHRQLPELAGAAAELLRPTRANSARPHASRRASHNFTSPTWGSSGLLYPVTLAGQPQHLWVSRGSFFQVNRHLLETLVATATSGPANSPPRPLAWDLFAGVGLFTRALAPHFAGITAVESAASAAADLASARLPNLRIITSTVLDFLRNAVLDRERPDLVLLDPPRAGLGFEAAALLTRLRVPRIAYVSCDPGTLARDLRAMLSSGYNLAELHLVDMFPQTRHLETVAILHLA